jgi:hypothetical protein
VTEIGTITLAVLAAVAELAAAACEPTPAAARASDASSASLKECAPAMDFSNMVISVICNAANSYLRMPQGNSIPE